MEVRAAMTPIVATVGPGHSLQDAAKLMASRGVGSALVIDPESHGPAIITERDVLISVAAGQTPCDELVSEHLSRTLIFAGPEWSLEEAASTMVSNSVRHLIVIEGGEPVGMISSRDILRQWTAEGSTCRVAPTLSTSSS